MSMKLYTSQGNFRSFKIFIAASYNDIDIEFVNVEDPNNKVDICSLSPLGKLPVLETPNGRIFESNAIARYISRMRRDTEIYGVSFYESGLIDSWIDFSTNEIELPGLVWTYPVLGLLPYHEETTSKARNDLRKGLLTLDNYLLDKTFLVGDKITLADITVSTALVYPFKIVCTPQYLSEFPNVMRWFNTLVNQPQFLNVIGKVIFAEVELLPSMETAPVETTTQKQNQEEKKQDESKKEKQDKPKKEKPPKQDKPKKEDKPKEEKTKEEKPIEDKPKEVQVEVEVDDNGIPIEKKEDHVLKKLDLEKPSPMYLDTWKKIYSNTQNYDDAMNQFWEMLDYEGYSLWRCNYLYNEENKILFKTSNLVSGFLQRSGDVRKWAFGCMWILGNEELGLEVTGMWLIRGKSIQPLIDANDDAAYYQWINIPFPISDENKLKVKELWCSETEIENKIVSDYKCFK